MAAAVVLPGCRRDRPLPPILAPDFEVTVGWAQRSSFVDPETNVIHNNVCMTVGVTDRNPKVGDLATSCMDIHPYFEEIRDEEGRSLVECWLPPRGWFPSVRTNPMGTRHVPWTRGISACLSDLTALPQRLSVVRGSVILVQASEITILTLRGDPTHGMKRLADYVELAIKHTPQRDKSTLVTYRYRIGPINRDQRRYSPRFIELEFLDDSGRAIPTSRSNTLLSTGCWDDAGWYNSARWTLKVPSGGPLPKVRATIATRIEHLRLPLLAENIKFNEPVETVVQRHETNQ